MNISQISGNFIFDMDEVLVDISPSFYRSIRFNWRKYNRWFNDLGPKDKKEIINRPVFEIDQWLLKDSIKKLSQDKKELITNDIKKLIFGDFFSQDIYYFLEPTEFARKTIMNKSFIEHARVNKIYILTRCVGTLMVKYKKNFVKKWFNHPKVELIIVDIDEKKSDVIKKLSINWNLFVDDEIRNIADFAENFNIEGKEFLIPATGYNKMPLALDILIKEKGGVYNYYEKNLE
jgi:hypothetical protein